VVAKDFALMGQMGANVVRVFTVPPVWLLDMAAAAGLRVLVGIPWSQHITFLDSRKVQGEIIQPVAEAVRGLNRHPAIFAYPIGNEIPPDMIRWHDGRRVRYRGRLRVKIQYLLTAVVVNCKRIVKLLSLPQQPQPA